MSQYHIDTGLHTYEIEAEDDQDAIDQFPNACIWRDDGEIVEGDWGEEVIEDGVGVKA